MKKRMNILLITTDQQRFDTIGAAGYQYMKTPNLDELASEGCIYTHAYSPNPVCIPARHNLLCGVGCRYHTMDDNYFDDSHQIPLGVPTFATLLANAGYDTKAIGKMHFQPARQHNGFNSIELMDELPRYREEDEYAQYLRDNGLGHIQSIHGVRHALYMQPQQSLIDEKHHGSTWVADRTIDYILNRCQDRPFCCWAGFIAPHPPFDVPTSFAHLYDDVKIPEPIESKTSISSLAKENSHMGNYANHEVLMRAKRLYYASISFVDHQVGRIIKALKDSGQYDNTMIVFTSDHGEMMGDMGTYQKFLPYDGSSRIPFIVRAPGYTTANSVCDDLVDLNDLFPTFLDVANVRYPQTRLYGGSLFSHDKNRRFQYIEHQHGQRRWVSINDKNYKYNYYFAAGREELFDLSNDPKETTNLLEVSDKYESLRSYYRHELVHLELLYGLEGTVENGDFIKYPDFEPKYYLECNPPFMSKHLSSDEQTKLNSLEHELVKAIIDEPLVKLDDLKLSYFYERNVLNEETLKKEASN